MILHLNDAQRDLKFRLVNEAKAMGKAWQDQTIVPADVQREWDVLIKHEIAPIDSGSGDGVEWKWAALRLLIAADEASSGVGYAPEDAKGVAHFAWDELTTTTSEKRTLLPSSLTTDRVPPAVVTVLPKARTPESGCTLRSLTHHLALLPGSGVLRAEWNVIGGANLDADKRKEVSATGALNVLLVPFPYVVHGMDFCPSPTRKLEPNVTGNPGYFFVNNVGWLANRGTPLTGDEFGRLR